MFEELILSAYQSKGYVITRNLRYSGDGGIDGIIHDPQGVKYLVQAKRYAKTVKSAHIHQFVALCRQKGCNGLFVHTGSTSGAMLANYDKAIIAVISGQKLIDLVCPASSTSSPAVVVKSIDS